MVNPKCYIRDTIEPDVYPIAQKMRTIDVYECWAVANSTPHKELDNGFRNSLVCKTVVYEDSPIAMYGVVPTSGKDVGQVWLLGTYKIKKAKELFIYTPQKYLNELFAYRKVLFNFVAEKNDIAIKWLQYLGFTMKNPVPYGVEKKEFRMFFKVKESNNV